MDRNAIVVVIALVALAGGWYLLSGTQGDTPQTVETNPMPVIGSTTPETIVENAAAPVTVLYTEQGFSPQSITIPLGTTVTFVNQSSKDMWVASAMHPSHMVYSGTSVSEHCPDTANVAFDECAGDAPGSSFTFTFNKEGAWKYHDHIDTSKFGTVIVAATP